MKILKLLAVVFLIALFTTSCTRRITDFTIISSKNVSLSEMGNYKRSAERVTGEDRMHMIIIIPTKLEISVKEALDNTIEATPGCVALVDGVINAENMHFVLYGTSAIIVEGTPLIDPKLAALERESNYMISEIDVNGETKVKYVSEDEFNTIKSEMAD